MTAVAGETLIADAPPRRRPRLVMTGTAAVIAVVVWQGVVRRPTPPAAGDALHPVDSPRETPESAAARPTLRVASFNIAGGVGQPDGKLNLDRTAGVLQDLDLVGLEEVHGGSAFAPRDQADLLGEKLHLPWLFAPSESRWWRDSFGNGALTALPVTRWERLPLSTRPSASNRTLLRLTATWHSRPLAVLVTHLDRGADHDTELAPSWPRSATPRPRPSSWATSTPTRRTRGWPPSAPTRR